MNAAGTCAAEIDSELKNFERLAVHSLSIAPLDRCRKCGQLYVLPGANPDTRPVPREDAEHEFGMTLEQ